MPPGEGEALLVEMDVIAAGEESYAAMRRSNGKATPCKITLARDGVAYVAHLLCRYTTINGGGENSPMLEAEDDYYELFFAGL